MDEEAKFIEYKYNQRKDSKFLKSLPGATALTAYSTAKTTQNSARGSSRVVKRLQNSGRVAGGGGGLIGERKGESRNGGFAGVVGGGGGTGGIPVSGGE